MLSITYRNVKIFFRDKASVFFSLLSVFIVIGLYALFLGDSLVSGLSMFGDNARDLANNWIIAGLLAVSSITTTMGAFGIMVEDRHKKILKDFNASPIKRSALAGGYILSSFFIGLIMSGITLVLGQIYVVLCGGDMITFEQVLLIIPTILLSVLSSSALIFFIVSFFKSQNAFATASTVIGTLIGFITGIYIPIGQLPEAVQFVIKIFPVSHAVVLMRNILMSNTMDTAMSGVPPQAVEEFEIMFGNVYKFGDFTVTPFMSVLVLIATALLFYGLAILNISRKKK